MANTAKIRRLQVRPSESADLAFGVAGVIAKRGKQADGPGAEVKAFDERILLSRFKNGFSHFEELALSNLPGGLIDFSQLVYDAVRIEDDIGDAALFALDNQSLAIQLDQLIRRRQNAFLQYYSHRDKVVEVLTSFYGPPTADAAKYTREDGLTKLAAAMDSRLAKLDAAYQADNPGDPSGVVKSTTSVSKPQGFVRTNTFTSAVGTQSRSANLNPNPQITETLFTYNSTVGDNVLLESHANTTSDPIQNVPIHFENGQFKVLTGEVLSGAIEVDYPLNSTFRQTTTTESGYYTLPREENISQHHEKRLQIEEQLTRHRLFAVQVPHLQRILDNERHALDLDVAKVQFSYLRTILTSPIAGLVTAVYKDVGEFVTPGDPVLRVDNDRVVFLQAIR